MQTSKDSCLTICWVENRKTKWYKNQPKQSQISWVLTLIDIVFMFFDRLKWAKSSAEISLEIWLLSDWFGVISTIESSVWQHYERHNQRTNCHTKWNVYFTTLQYLPEKCGFYQIYLESFLPLWALYGNAMNDTIDARIVTLWLAPALSAKLLLHSSIVVLEWAIKEIWGLKPTLYADKKLRNVRANQFYLSH